MSYIVIEGLEYAGKTTLAKEINAHFKSRIVREPFSESLHAAEVRRLVCGAHMESVYETQLLIASRIELFKKLSNYMRPNSSTALISDRSFITNMVYQAKDNADVDRILNLNREVLKVYGFNIFPHLIIYIKVPYEIALARSQSRGVDNKRDQLVISSKHKYEELQERYEYALKLVKEYSPNTHIVTSVVEDNVDDTDKILAVVERVLCKHAGIPVKQFA